MKKILVILSAIFLVFGVVGQANSSIIAYDLPPGTAGNQGYQGSLGLDFRVNTPIVVYALGVFDHLSNGLFGTLKVQLFDLSATTSPLAGEVFDGTAGTGQAFLFSDLDPAIPLVLSPGDYSVVAFGFDVLPSPPPPITTNLDLNYNTGLDPFDIVDANDGGGLLTFLGYRWEASTDILFPDANVVEDLDNPDRFGAGTFRYKPVPEPGTLFLLGSGLVGLAGLGRKKFFKK